jgi:hypothetical protein
MRLRILKAQVEHGEEAESKGQCHNSREHNADVPTNFLTLSMVRPDSPRHGEPTHILTTTLLSTGTLRTGFSWFTS